MKAEILTIGDEVLRGEIVDSNKSLLSDRLLSLDIETHFHVSVRDDPADMPATLTVPSWLVNRQGRTEVEYFNNSPVSVRVAREDVRVLYSVGGFEGNFLRSILLAAFPLMFMAGAGVLAGSFLSFPVGCLVSFMILPFGLMRDFLAGALQAEMSAPIRAGMIFQKAGYVIFTIMRALLPDLSSPANYLVDGMNVEWVLAGASAVLTLSLRVLLVLVLACLIFQKRELAGVHV